MKRLLVGCGVLVLLLVVVLIGIGAWLTAGPGVMEINTYHPFRSLQAKEQFLALYDQKAREWPVPSDTITVPTSYGQTFVRISGPDSAPPMVLMHGGGGNSLHWRPNIAALSGRYRTFAVDNVYDFGRSVYLKPMKTADDFVRWLDEVLAALGLDHGVNMVGLSYGGWLTSQYGQKHPERIEKVVLIAPAGTVLPLSGGWIARAVLCALPHKSFTRRFLFWLLEDLANLDDASRQQLNAEIDAAYLAIRSFKLKQLAAPTVLTDQELASVRVPTLFLVGENEKIYDPVRAVGRLNSVAPQIQTEIILGAGHDLTIVQADTVNAKILAFLSGSPTED